MSRLLELLRILAIPYSTAEQWQDVWVCMGCAHVEDITPVLSHHVCGGCGRRAREVELDRDFGMYRVGRWRTRGYALLPWTWNQGYWEFLDT